MSLLFSKEPNPKSFPVGFTNFLRFPYASKVTTRHGRLSRDRQGAVRAQETAC
jgi:hypothetical protein